MRENTLIPITLINWVIEIKEVFFEKEDTYTRLYGTLKIILYNFPMYHNVTEFTSVYILMIYFSYTVYIQFEAPLDDPKKGLSLASKS